LALVDKAEVIRAPVPREDFWPLMVRA